MAAAHDPVAPLLAGIDVSHYQQAIDWEAVARGGVQYSFIKATEGASFVDARFTHNWAAAAQAGLPRGAYHFFRPSVSPAKQADRFVRTLKQLQPGDLPPVLDLEAPENWSMIPAPQRAPLALEWLEAVEARLSVTPIVYLSPAFATEVLLNAEQLARYPLWVAHYTTAAAPDVPKPWKSWTFWQYTDQAKISGIPGLVDADRFNGSRDDLKALTVSPHAPAHS